MEAFIEVLEWLCVKRCDGDEAPTQQQCTISVLHAPRERTARIGNGTRVLFHTDQANSCGDTEVDVGDRWPTKQRSVMQTLAGGGGQNYFGSERR